MKATLRWFDQFKNSHKVCTQLSITVCPSGEKAQLIQTTDNTQNTSTQWTMAQIFLKMQLVQNPLFLILEWVTWFLKWNHMKIYYHSYALIKWSLQWIQSPCICADYWKEDMPMCQAIGQKWSRDVFLPVYSLQSEITYIRLYFILL